MLISYQPSFLYSFGDFFETGFAEANIDGLPAPYRAMLDAGIAVASGSDFPCAPVEPLLGLFALVARRGRSNGPMIVPNQAITALEALRTYTLNSAAAMFRDQEVGSIEVGKRADLVVLSHDPTLVAPDFIREIQVQQTYIDGDLAYSV